MEAVILIVVLTGIAQMWCLSRIVSAIKDLQRQSNEKSEMCAPVTSRESAATYERRASTVVHHLPLADHKAVNPHVQG